MTDARQIIDALGNDALMTADDLIGKRTIAEWRSKNTIPAQWFHLIESMCLDAGVDCPREAFTFKALHGAARSERKAGER